MKPPTHGVTTNQINNLELVLFVLPFVQMSENRIPTPQGERCAKRRRLLDLWAEATHEYGNLLESGTPSTALLRAAGLKCDEARKRFDEHCSEHNCSGGVSNATPNQCEQIEEAYPKKVPKSA